MISLQPIAHETFTVRLGDEQDIPEIADIDAEVSGVYKRHYWDELLLNPQTDEPRIALVAEREGHLLGFIVGVVRAWEFGSEPCGWVFAVSVRPAEREYGVASALLRALSASFRRLGVRKIRTMVLRSDHLIMSFFRSQGMMAGPFLELEQDLPE